MSKGFLYIGDEVSSFPKDQVCILDRIIEKIGIIRSISATHIRSRMIRSKNLSDALQKVRSKSMDLKQWRSNSRCEAIISLGFSEAKGGGSTYWFKRQYASLVFELKELGFIPIIVQPMITNVNDKHKINWFNIAQEITTDAALKYSLEIIDGTIKSSGVWNDLYIEGVTNFAKRIASKVGEQKKTIVEAIEKPFKKIPQRIAHVTGRSVFQRPTRPSRSIPKPKIREKVREKIREKVRAKEIVKIEKEIVKIEIDNVVQLKPIKKSSKVKKGVKALPVKRPIQKTRVKIIID